MFDYPLRQLPTESSPLLKKFYRAHRSHMRMPANARGWVAEHSGIVAGLCLTPVEHGHWLTGLLVAPKQRNQGLAQRLVKRALASCDGPVWLFCEPKLSGLYMQLGFHESARLPESLACRLQRYNRNKTLLALCHDNERPRMFTAILKIAAACLFDESGRLLVVRKRGSHIFMLPGGKTESNETPLQTLCRELEEEIGLSIEESRLQPLGHFQARAANEPDHWVEAEVFVGYLTDEVAPQAEIEALDWVELHLSPSIPLAPLLRERIIPALLLRSSAEGAAIRTPG